MQKVHHVLLLCRDAEGKAFSVLLLNRRWYPEDYKKMPSKKSAHRYTMELFKYAIGFCLN